MKKFLWLILITLLFLPTSALAESAETVWNVVDEHGVHITYVSESPDVGDQYISGDNCLYEIIRVESGSAVAADKGAVELPDVSWLDADEALPVSAAADRLVAFYCTHSDESYKPSDGTYSNEKRGSIYEVAHALADAMADRGAQTEVSDALHHPHDAGAYRRSRQTAVQLLKTGPSAIFDIHRDGIPDPDEYAVTIGGKKASKVRILVGRGNQNMEVNKKFALTVKAIADKVYPGLIKDIYMGKGTYNQDLAPHSLLLENGTYTLSKERVLTSAPMMADVLYRALYGGVTGSAGRSDVRGTATTQRPGGVTEGATDVPETVSNAGTGSGILWVMGIGVVGLIVYAVLSTGSLKGGMHKAGRHMSEMTGGLIGKKPEDDEKPPEA